MCVSKSVKDQTLTASPQGDGAVFDVVVAGAGPAGAIAARHLARAGRSVVMLDRLRSHAPRLGETLPGAAQRLLVQQGLADLAVPGPQHARVGGGLTVWGDGHVVASDTLRDPYGPGLRLDRAQFDADLRQASLEASCFWWKVNVSDIKRQDGLWVIGLDDGRILRASYIIDATGRSARIVRLLGVAQQRGTALVSLYQVAKPQKNADLERTLIEATPDGWIYAGRLADGFWAIGYHTLPQEAVRLRRSPDYRVALFTETPHLTSCLGALEWVGPFFARDARSLSAITPCGEGWCAVGDAALAFDPIAGQGLFNALRTGVAAAEGILASPAAGLSAYAQELSRVRAIYTTRRQSLYRSESRWLDRDFWKTQQDQVAVPVDVGRQHVAT
ncbi:dehydrogenase [Agrobacterium vitis]|nr:MULTISPECIES: FAD-dependent monooxygenase [Rhizobium/Agrobacterium group]MCF1432630.1 dehydrogenase [Allorhizobium ampelinum]MUO87834.1 dehydrogenase [Agrobacterium vitis]MUZ51037.1 dehydrogenase [Agrobacterium vitis]MUZ90636.1 dehydrogenase [Agrobacterium vitis]MVA38582.1 dehydrogenase [Agrobacterium vitis]